MADTLDMIAHVAAVGIILAIAVTPLSSEAQPAGKVARVGLLVPAVWDPDHPQVVGFQERLRELGYTQGQNLALVARGGPVERLPDLAADLLTLKIDVIVAWSSPAILAVRRATTSVPIVMAASGDAVATGHVASLARPGGNVTGLSWHSTELVAKWVQLLREIIPQAARIGVLWDSTDPTAVTSRAALVHTTKALSVHFELVEALTLPELAAAFERAKRARVDALLTIPHARNHTRPREIAKAALDHRLPTIFGDAVSVRSGGLIAYTVDFVDMSRRAADYVDRILKGTRPADLPVEQPTKYHLIINVKTARLLGLTVPPALLLRADEVIE